MHLHRLLKARNRDRTVSHWVTIIVVMSEVKTMTMAHAQSKRGVSCFVATCRSTEVHENKNLTNFEDDFFNATHK